jgi:hypothetical protein
LFVLQDGLSFARVGFLDFVVVENVANFKPIRSNNLLGFEIMVVLQKN